MNQQDRSIMTDSPDDAVITIIGFDYTAIPKAKDLLETWIAIGNRNPWIRHAYDPPLTRRSFEACDAETFFELIMRTNWCLGTAFYIDNLCFIQQVGGGDEWLTIKGDTAFESISWRCIIEKEGLAGARAMMADLVAATLEECRTLNYESAADRREREKLCFACSGCDIDCPL